MEYLNKEQNNKNIIIVKGENIIEITFFFNCGNEIKEKCKSNDLIENIFRNYASKIGENLDLLFFVFQGEVIERSKFKLTLDEIIRKNYIENNKIIILAYKNELNCSKENIIYQKNHNKNNNHNNINNQNNNNKNEIIVTFNLNSNENYRIKTSWDNNIKDICIKYVNDKGLDFSLLRFKYDGKIIDLEKKFGDIVNNWDRLIFKMIIQVYTGNPLIITFLYKNKSEKLKCFKEDKVKDILNNYCKIIKENINHLQFYFENNSPIEIDSEQIFIELFNNDTNNYFDSKEDFNANEIKYNDKNEIIITVKDKNDNPIYSPINESNCNDKKKCLIIKITIPILILITIGILIYIFSIHKSSSKQSSNNSSNNASQNLSDSIDSDDTPKICSDGYFIPDDETHQDCKKCSLEGCKKCKGTYEKNDCISCGLLQSIYENNKIIKCNNSCEIGEEEKCLKCYENKTECEICNLGYSLVKGKCKSDYLIKVTYLTSIPNEEINLSDVSIYVSEMLIDGENFYRISKYIFPEKGYHTVYFRFLPLTIGYDVYLFSGNENIISVKFLNFDEYIPAINFKGMFSKCTNLTSVDFSKISFENYYRYDFNDIFNGCINLKYVNFYNFNTDKLDNMFYNCISLISIDLSKLNTIQTKTFENMFYNCISLKSINLKGINLESVTNINYMFYNCISLESIDLSDFQPHVLEKMENVFSNCINLTYINLNNFDTQNVVYMNYLFYNCSSLKYINLTDFNTKNVKYLNNTFSYCTSLKSIDIFNFETNKVEYMNSMFSHCYSLESINLLSFVTDNIKDMNSMFSHCYSLKNIKFNKKNFLTDNVQNMTSFFSHCYSLTTIDLSNFNTKNVKYFNNMFSHCYSLTTIDLSNFNTEKVVNFDNMFSYCYSLKEINISHFNCKSYTSINKMFSGCYSLTSIDLSNFKNNEYPYYAQLFYDCPNLNYINITIFSAGLRNYQKLFNTNISSNGVLIINQDYYNFYHDDYKFYLPSNWTIFFE